MGGRIQHERELKLFRLEAALRVAMKLPPAPPFTNNILRHTEIQPTV
jgi:hypothetical protein